MPCDFGSTNNLNIVLGGRLAVSGEKNISTLAAFVVESLADELARKTLTASPIAITNSIKTFAKTPGLEVCFSLNILMNNLMLAYYF